MWITHNTYCLIIPVLSDFEVTVLGQSQALPTTGYGGVLQVHSLGVWSVRVDREGSIVSANCVVHAIVSGAVGVDSVLDRFN